LVALATALDEELEGGHARNSNLRGLIAISSHAVCDYGLKRHQNRYYKPN
jgi:hypothetical protein